MIRDLTDTTTTEVSKTLVRLRNDVGAMALGRVLTLIVVVDDTHAAEAVDVANHASRQHPCRIIVLIPGERRGRSRLDAQIRLGGDAGASEIVILRLYGPLAKHGPSVVVPLLLPDSPIVAWWPGEAPDDVGNDPIGAMAQRRITDAAEARNSRQVLKKRAQTYRPGDTDLSWTRLTRWRGLLAAALDQPPYETVTSAVVSGAPDIFFARDDDGDGRADHREVLYSGFEEANPQHRVNGFEYGLDGWLYLASGVSNNGITCARTGEVVNISGRDLRIDPDSNRLEAVSGRSQPRSNAASPASCST